MGKPRPAEKLGKHDPARGFVYETVPYVSAATLAYDRNPPPIQLVDRTKKKRGVIRLASPFTVESESPARYLSADDPPTQQHDSDIVRAVVSALETSGVNAGGERLRVEGMEPHLVSGGSIITHTADSNRGRIAVAVFPDDIIVPPSFAQLAAGESLEIECETVLLVAFTFEAWAGGQVEGVQVLRAQANRDLMIGNLADHASDTAFILVGEPTVAVVPVETPEPIPHYRCEVLGYQVFDPATGNLRNGGGGDIQCWMIDTNHDCAQPFCADRLHFPGQGKDRQLLNLARALGPRLNRDAWEAMLSLTSMPFPVPRTGQIAVRIITHAGAEMAVVLPVPPR